MQNAGAGILIKNSFTKRLSHKINEMSKGIIFGILFLLAGICFHAAAQPAQGIFTKPLVTIDFGNSSNSGDINLSLLKQYNKVNGNCPDDGNYAFASSTRNCFGGQWHSLPADHSPADVDGRMMIVNAARNAGPFFMLNIAGLKAGGTYQLAQWLVNICRPGDECTGIAPLITVSILCDGKLLKSFTTGEIAPAPEPEWKKYAAVFTLPENSTAITLQMNDNNPGGCGNDFALDDITLQEYMLQAPVIAKAKEPAPIPVAAEKKAGKTTTPPVIKKTGTAPPPAAKPTAPALAKNTATDNPIKITPQVKEINKTITLPRPIATRANPVIKQIETAAAELLIELYDNGQVDGDTVSIYHNNQLMISRAGLSEKPLKMKITVNALQPHHELIMVAENLGSIPPNTSLMVITARDKRYEIFISSSEQKNAKIVIDFKEN